MRIQRPRFENEKIATRADVKNFDERGYFSVILQESIDWHFDVKQQSVSKSNFNVLRGMHAEEGQSQVVTVIYGKILDIVIDMREVSIKGPCIQTNVLSSESVNQIYIPDGCFHGYYVQSNEAIVHYSSNTVYTPTAQKGINWKSPQLIKLWGALEPVVSDRDSKFPTLDEYIEKKF